ncbi:MAG: tRNA 2-thiouridine(34) synthase MnmA [Candidatus Taylorbacteria bacterium]|nr:tRNA 2-thiouridine(34) synthase MnmA [Candidatus Taylorbacteria bacterium]
MKSNIKKVFVGLSGGVDSSVTAVLLKKAGYDVTGVFIKVWQPDWIKCTWKEDRLDAMRICAVLDIPFITLDLEKEYKKEVIDYMIFEYGEGRTPNPDVMCNKYIKFGSFYDFAMKNGAQYVATGHYACVKDNSLSVGVDSNKDQSYFLWQIKNSQLSHVLFPVGHLKKPEVRKLAEKFNLITFDKKDSQGLCFIGKVSIKDFLKHFIETTQGKVLNMEGKVIGDHEGSIFFTLGERHGFNVTEKSSDDKPYYVVSKNIKENTITVSHKSPDGALEKQVNKLRLINVNWITPIDSNKKYMARARYRAPLQSCTITLNTECLVSFDAPQNAITPGQSLVVYDGEECKGGGIIVI